MSFSGTKTSAGRGNPKTSKKQNTGLSVNGQAAPKAGAKSPGPSKNGARPAPGGAKKVKDTKDDVTEVKGAPKEVSKNTRIGAKKDAKTGVKKDAQTEVKDAQTEVNTTHEIRMKAPEAEGGEAQTGGPDMTRHEDMDTGEGEACPPGDQGGNDVDMEVDQDVGPNQPKHIQDGCPDQPEGIQDGGPDKPEQREPRGDIGEENVVPADKDSESRHPDEGLERSRTPPDQVKPKRDLPQVPEDIRGKKKNKTDTRAERDKHGCQDFSGEGSGGYSQLQMSTGQVGNVSAQKAIQLQRSLQASKQMAYQVFANVVTALEEYEQREARRMRLTRPERSEAYIPDQSFKNDEDVLAGVQAQLIVFQTHLKVCPKEVASECKFHMIETVLNWAAARSEVGLKTTSTDEYALNLLEILFDGATRNTFQMLKESHRELSKAELMDGVGKIMAGQFKADKLDKEFHDDPRKEAKALPIRQGKDISLGIIRMLSLQPDAGLEEYLQTYLESESAR